MFTRVEVLKNCLCQGSHILSWPVGYLAGGCGPPPAAACHRVPPPWHSARPALPAVSPSLRQPAGSASTPAAPTFRLPLGTSLSCTGGAVSRTHFGRPARLILVLPWDPVHTAVTRGGLVGQSLCGKGQTRCVPTAPCVGRSTQFLAIIFQTRRGGGGVLECALQDGGWGGREAAGEWVEVPPRHCCCGCC